MSNIRKVMAALDEITNRPSDHPSPALLTIEAFDNVGWECLNRALDRLEVLGPFRVYLSSLYACPLARIYTAGHLSDSFPLQKGIQQWCPLSPLLFNLAMEPLSRYLMEAPEIRVIKIGTTELKLAQFVKDDIFYLAQPSEDIPIVFEHLQAFGKAWALKSM